MRIAVRNRRRTRVICSAAARAQQAGPARIKALSSTERSANRSFAAGHKVHSRAVMTTAETSRGDVCKRAPVRPLATQLARSCCRTGAMLNVTSLRCRQVGLLRTFYAGARANNARLPSAHAARARAHNLYDRMYNRCWECERLCCVDSGSWRTLRGLPAAWNAARAAEETHDVSARATLLARLDSLKAFKKRAGLRTTLEGAS